jgi:hypothetical protein
LNWARSIRKADERKIIAIDGKTVRGHFKTGSKALHVVNARTTENRLVFGQVKMDEKSNEITAISDLLEKLALEGCIVTIDAMGCQYKNSGQNSETEGGLSVFVEREQGDLSGNR